MARILFDFADAKQAERFPRHGWAKNSQGVKLLWLPSVHLFRKAQVVRAEKGAKPLDSEYLLDIEPFEQRTRRLALTLREIHQLIRKSPGPPSAHKRPEDWSHWNKMNDLLPLYTEMAYVYLRSLADDLAIACRLVLFSELGQAPSGDKAFEKLKAFVEDPNKVQHAKPICDVRLLKRAFTEHSSWFGQLRGERLTATGKKKGVRDAILHRPTTPEIFYIGDEPKLEVFLFSRSRDVDGGLELISTLQDIVEDLCGLLTGICSSVGWGNEYEAAGLLPTGIDDDFTGFWPEI